MRPPHTDASGTLPSGLRSIVFDDWIDGGPSSGTWMVNGVRRRLLAREDVGEAAQR